MALADVLAMLETRTLGETLCNIQAETMVNTPADTPPEVKAETLGDKLRNEEA